MKRVLVGRGAMSLAMANALFGLAGCGGSDGSVLALSAEAAPNRMATTQARKQPQWKKGPVPAPAPAPEPAPAPAPAPEPAPAPAPPPATTYSATVSWSMPLLNTNGTSLTDVSGYRIYYGTSPNSLTLSVPVSGAEVTSGVISGLAPGTYYFAVSTLNSAGASSDLTNVASKTVP